MRPHGVDQIFVETERVHGGDAIALVLFELAKDVPLGILRRVEVRLRVEQREMAVCVDETRHYGPAGEIHADGCRGRGTEVSIIADLLDASTGENDGDVVTRWSAGAVDEAHVSQHCEGSVCDGLGWRLCGERGGESECKEWNPHIDSMLPKLAGTLFLRLHANTCD